MAYVRLTSSAGLLIAVRPIEVLPCRSQATTTSSATTCQARPADLGRVLLVTEYRVATGALM